MFFQSEELYDIYNLIATPIQPRSDPDWIRPGLNSGIYGTALQFYLLCTKCIRIFSCVLVPVAIPLYFSWLVSFYLFHLPL